MVVKIGDKRVRFQIRHWDTPRPPIESELREQFFREGLFPYEWSNAPGDSYPAYTHDYPTKRRGLFHDKVIYVASGSITWLLPQTNESIETRAGDRIDLPRGTLHAAQVGSQGVTCLEGHLE
jgi:hypothetical protein